MFTVLAGCSGTLGQEADTCEASTGGGRGAPQRALAKSWHAWGIPPPCCLDLLFVYFFGAMISVQSYVFFQG